MEQARGQGSRGQRSIKVVGAREHNLKNISVDIPKDSLVVITGPSGSGKSSLAMDVLYAEGQRRYLESLSSYARQFLGMPAKPDVDRIEGLCPAIAIDQKTVGSNPRSTVGTITELYDYLRVLYARIGTISCPSCKQNVESASPQTVAEALYERFAGKDITITAPLALERKGEFVKELERVYEAGYHRFFIDGKKISFSSKNDIAALQLKKTHKHTIDVYIDAFTLETAERSRLYEAVAQACALANNVCTALVDTQVHRYAAARMCVSCYRSFPELEPRLFSFNSPLGACKHCHGLGMEPAALSLVLAGEAKEKPCGQCNGKRLHEAALAVTVGSKNIYEISEFCLTDLHAFLSSLKLTEQQHLIAQKILAEIERRVGFLLDVGLGYLSLNRPARTLSGGEGQRVRLATHIGSPLSGILYVLDEPSIGLHQRDNDRLITSLKRLRDLGNTVVVVEHDTDTMLNADYLIDMGPAAGKHGGNIVAIGTPETVMADKESLTGAYLAGRKAIVKTDALRKPTGYLTLHDASTNNLKNLTVRFPLGVLCGISGVSGSGKSTLITQELVPTIQAALYRRGSKYSISKIDGLEQIESLVLIDQTPIGRTPRSNPATYLGIFDDIRRLFASLPESNARGYNQGRFSFNVGEGRCAHCSGEGTITVSMHFLPDVVLVCNRCQGKRYNAQTLDIMFKGKHIADILAMTITEAAVFFAAHGSIAKKLKLLCEVGLDYLTLGQSSTTLSGGEAQRVKLANELAKRGNKTLYILDEPTTGLHQADIEKLLAVFQALVEKGNTVMVIEHNIDVLKTVDYLIDLGPEGGDKGGTIVASGTPAEVAECKASHTGRYLKKVL